MGYIKSKVFCGRGRRLEGRQTDLNAGIEITVDLAEITVRTALVRSRIPGAGFVVNPYLGCAHGCLYCYAVFMRKYSRLHPRAPWGSFVEAKVNIAQVLRGELARKKKRGRAMLSSVCDPYQPAEGRFRLTRQCLEALGESGWGIDILTRSPMVTRDLDLLKAAPGTTVGFSIPTDDDRVRQVVEPNAPPIGARLAALRQVHAAGVSTWVFVAPMLPLDPERLIAAIRPFADSFMVDGLNYRGQVEALFRRRHWDFALTDRYGAETGAALKRLWGEGAE